MYKINEQIKEHQLRDHKHWGLLPEPGVKEKFVY